MLLINEGKQASSASGNLGESQKLERYAEYKESGIEDYMSYDIICMKFLEKAHIKKKKKKKKHICREQTGASGAGDRVLRRRRPQGGPGNRREQTGWSSLMGGRCPRDPSPRGLCSAPSAVLTMGGPRTFLKPRLKPHSFYYKKNSTRIVCLIREILGNVDFILI